MDACHLRVVFAGSAQLSGRDHFLNATYPFLMEQRLRRVTEAAGLELRV